MLSLLANIYFLGLCTGVDTGFTPQVSMLESKQNREHQMFPKH